MWPKALSQLIELAPHITRLIPMADRFLQSKTSTEDAARGVMEQMSEGLRGDLGQVTAAHAGLYRMLNEQDEKLSLIAADVHSLTSSASSLETRLTRLEQQISRLWLFLSISLLFLVAVCILSVLILVHLH